jgi:hypothetical protein
MSKAGERITEAEGETTTIPFETLRQKWMTDPKFREEYERIGTCGEGEA